jgi:hypothetical protein
MPDAPTPAPAPGSVPTAAPSLRARIARTAPTAAPVAAPVAAATGNRSKYNYNAEQKKAFNAARQRLTRQGSANPTEEAHALMASEIKSATRSAARAKTAAPVTKAVTKAPRAVVAKVAKVAKPARVVKAVRSRKTVESTPVAATPRGRSQAIRPVRGAVTPVSGVSAPDSATVVVSVFGSKQSFYPMSLKEWNQLGSSLFA